MTLFENTEQALIFAYNYTGQNCITARLSLEPFPTTGKGLGGLNGAAQAGMIRREVSSAGRLIESLITAKYAPMWRPCSCGHACCSGKIENKEWAEAIPYIVLDVCKNALHGADRGTVVWCVKAYYSGSILPIRQIASIASVSEKTITRNFPKIINYLRGTKSKEGMDAVAYRTVDRILTDKGVVGELK